MTSETQRPDRGEGPEELKVARVVKAIPEEVPSMAWRSALNERVLDAAKRKQKRRLWARIWVPMASVGSAGAVATIALAVWFGGSTPTETPNGPTSLEASMVAVHRENVHFADIAGPGLSEADAVPSKRTDGGEVQWEEGDLEAL